MSATKLRWPATTVVALLAAFTTWISLFAWRGLVETPSGYLVPALTVCLLVAVSGMLLRSARVPRLLVPLGQAAVLVLWVTRSWSRDLAWGGWLPTPESLTEVGLRINGGALAAQAYAAPVPDDAPIIFALLIAAAAGAALLVDFLAVGLRRVPLAGLPLLAVYTVPVSILGEGVSWWVFVVAALSFLALLAADESEHLVHWGRQISSGGRLFDSTAEPVSTQAVRASARKIGFTATGLALVVPIAIPTFDTGLFGSGGPGPGGDGDAVSITNPMTDFRRNLIRGADTDWIWLTTDDPDPSYLRISVLDTFDGETWKPSGRDIPVEQRASGRMPRPPGLEPEVERSEVGYELQVGSDFRSTWLPTPYPVAAIDVPGDWRYDANTLDVVSAAKDQSTENLDYSLVGLRVDPTAEQLASASPAGEDVFTPNTELPGGAVEVVRDLTRDLTDDAPTRFEKAVALQEWFRRDGGFEYSLERSSPGNGVDELEDFLSTEGRVGYCEQFASAMAVMGRSIGIPSRVAVGFLRPDPLEDGTFVYSAHDLHAWPEMYFEGTGWVRFEPTPAERATSIPGYTSQRLPQDDPNGPVPSDPAADQQNRLDRESEAAAPVDDPDGNGGGSARATVVPLLVGLLLGLLLALVPRTARSLVRRRRWAAAGTPVALAEAAWSELRDTALDLGVAWDDSVTLRTRARALVQSFGEPRGSGDDEDRLTRTPVTGPKADPQATQALERLVRFVEQARYARSVEAPEAVVEDAGRCTAALRNGATRRRRLRADWLPASLTDDLRVWLRSRSGEDRAVTGEPGVDHAV